jgi:hypothetical protein
VPFFMFRLTFKPPPMRVLDSRQRCESVHIKVNNIVEKPPS